MAADRPSGDIDIIGTSPKNLKDKIAVGGP